MRFRRLLDQELRAFGQCVAVRMADLQLTRAQVASRIPGFNVASISRIVHADPPQDVLLSTVIKLASALDTESHALLGSQEEGPLAPWVSPETAELVMVCSGLPRPWVAAVLAGVKALAKQVGQPDAEPPPAP